MITDYPRDRIKHLQLRAVQVRHYRHPPGGPMPRRHASASGDAGAGVVRAPWPRTGRTGLPTPPAIPSPCTGDTHGKARSGTPDRASNDGCIGNGASTPRPEAHVTDSQPPAPSRHADRKTGPSPPNPGRPPRTRISRGPFPIVSRRAPSSSAGPRSANSATFLVRVEHDRERRSLLSQETEKGRRSGPSLTPRCGAQTRVS
jgi:hypothetical protein